MPAKKIKIKLNGVEFDARVGETIFQVANRNNVDIPTLCEHPDFPHKANCRVCVVEVKGRRALATSCSTEVVPGMEITTNSERVKTSRNLNLELIFAEHVEKCATCVWRLNCKLLEYAEKYHIKINRFKDRKYSRKTYKFANAVEIDGSQCIDCRNCIDACSRLQNINYLEVKGKGHDQEIVPTKKSDIECILCGQCAVHCPVSSAQEQADWQVVEKLIKEGKKKVVVQFAGSVRISIGDDFGIGYGKISPSKFGEILRALGFAHAFDLSETAELSAKLMAAELESRIEKKEALPMLNASCPSMIRYFEGQYHDLLPLLSRVRSPHLLNGGLIKSYWSEKNKINQKDVVVVSVMPCTAQKYEVSRSELITNGIKPVDYVLTTREIAWMIKKNNLAFAKFSGRTHLDRLTLGQSASVYAGAGGSLNSIFSALIADFAEKGKKKAVFKELEYGFEGTDETFFNLKQSGQIRGAVANGMLQAQKLLPIIDHYDYVEMLACPNACVGGGGEPIPTSQEIRLKRVKALEKINSKADKKALVDSAQELINWSKEDKTGKREKLFYTKYYKRG